VAKKYNLPLLTVRGEGGEGAEPTRKKPSLDDARARLGGRGSDMPAAPVGIVPGRVVKVAASNGQSRIAVVLFANAKEVHVLVDGVRLRRLVPTAVELHEGEVPVALAKIAADARVFSGLAEGQPVRYADDAVGLVSGKLVEKCRYGALVVRDDGTVIAVGFRKLWPGAGASA